MVAPSAGAVVLVPFPWVLCQITSNPYGDPAALSLTNSDFASGGLHLASFAKPGKLFTAHQGLLVQAVGTLTIPAFDRILHAVVAILNPGS